VIYVDPLMHNGWIMRGRAIANCHRFTDEVELEKLHELAQKIGLKRDWFQNKPRLPHYDLTPTKRAAAIAAGAMPVDRRQAVALWQSRREKVAEHMEGLTP
jgi:hypothetical protein